MNNNIKNKRKIFKRNFYRSNYLDFTLGLIGIILQSVCSLGIAWLLQQILDAASGEEQALDLPTLTLVAIGLILGFAISGSLVCIFKPRFLSKAMKQYKNHAFEELIKKGISAFSGENTSNYISALSNDANTIESGYLTETFLLTENIICFVGAFAMMLFYSPMLTLAAFLFSMLPVIASLFAGNKLADAEKAVSDKNVGFVATLKDSLSGFSVIKSFKAEGRILSIFSRSNSDAEEAKCKKNRISEIIGLVSSISGAMCQFGVFIVGAVIALTSDSITPGVVIAFVQLMNHVLSPVGTVPGILARRKAATALIDKLADALSDNVRSEGEELPKNLCDGIEVKALSFGYEENNEILHGISTRFEAGKSYAIVGASGSGKSTLLNLLMAGHGNYGGEILFDGKELRRIDTASLYELVSLVQQNVFVFNSSIHDNITMYGNFDSAEVEKAITLSGLDGLIESRGADYMCGENGSALSGGEKQRISIARSLLRKSSVLLVDEATASLDKETAFHVSNSILDLKGLTRIVVTHSLDEALLSRYDRILTLKSGNIVEEGSFDELMNKKGYFYSLYTISQ